MRNTRKKVKSLHIWKRHQNILWYKVTGLSDYILKHYLYRDSTNNVGRTDYK